MQVIMNHIENNTRQLVLLQYFFALAIYRMEFVPYFHKLGYKTGRVSIRDFMVYHWLVIWSSVNWSPMITIRKKNNNHLTKAHRIFDFNVSGIPNCNANFG